jgi:4-amino-4-deoxy-L-arabinose transferase-like glycosyltransferase
MAMSEESTANSARARVISRKQGWLICLAFFAFVVFLRIPSFHRSVFDRDESVYILMARSLLNGEVPYTLVWDHKPPGIYLLFALSQLLFGYSVISVRIAACIAVTITCCLLYIFGKNVFYDKKIGLLAAVFYAVFSIKIAGFGSNTEIFFIPLVILGFYLLCIKTGIPHTFDYPKKHSFIIVGIVLGLSLQIKYVTIFDLVAIHTIVTIALLFTDKLQPLSRLIHIMNYNLLLSFGYLIPFIIVFLYFWINGHLAEYYYSNFVANLIYSSLRNFSALYFLKKLELRVETHFILWATVLCMPVFLYVFHKRYPIFLRDLGMVSIWLVFGFIGVCFTKRYYGHYFLQMLPPLCLIGAYIIIKTIYSSSITENKLRHLIFLLIILTSFLHTFAGSIIFSTRSVMRADIFKAKDTPSQVASYIKKQIRRDSLIYIVDYEPIVYYLVDVKIPTKYVLPTWLTNERFARVVGVDQMKELGCIMRLRPEFVIKRAQNEKSPFYDNLERYLKESYVLEYRFRDSIGDIEIYHFVAGDRTTFFSKDVSKD